jgi:hypothetical protein
VINLALKVDTDRGELLLTPVTVDSLKFIARLALATGLIEGKLSDGENPRKVFCLVRTKRMLLFHLD